MTDYYALHDLLAVEVSSRAEHIREGYRHYFRHFQIDAIVDSKVRYYVRDFSEFRLPPVYRKDGPYISFPSGFLIPKEKYAVVVRGGEIEEYTTYANRATNLLMQMLLVPQGVSLVHGAGVSLGGKGILFAGFGGVGKTLLVSVLKEQSDFLLFGDDYVMVGVQGLMYAYPADFSIYPYHRAVFPELKSTRFARYLARRRGLSPYYNGQRAINFFSRRLGRSGEPLFRGWNAPYVKVPAEYLIRKERIGVQQKLDVGVFLSRHNSSQPLLEEMSAKEFAATLVGNLKIEMMHSMPYLSVVHAFHLFDVVDFWVQTQSIIEGCAGTLKRFRLSIPFNIAQQAIAPTIMKSLEGII